MMKSTDPAPHALIVDDEKNILEFLAETLKRDHFAVTAASSGEEALEILKDHNFDLVILDLKLGGKVDGQRILEAIRWRWPSTVVIILTGHGTMESALDAIEEGVNGYLVKPARPADVREAIANAFYRRDQIRETQQEQTEKRVIKIGPIQVDLDRVMVQKNGDEIDLSPREFKLLVYLMQTAPQVAGPKDLVEIVREFEPDHMNEARDIIKWYIHRLRQKIEEDPARPRHILNVRGVGYRFSDKD